jgi:undecaprenyl-diphosphatase
VSSTGDIGQRGETAGAWLRQVEQNARGTIATLVRPPSRPIPWPDAAHAALGAGAAIAAVVGTMLLFDAWALRYVAYLPQRLVAAFDAYTNLGEAGYFLWPLGIVLLALAAFDSPAIPKFSRQTLAAWSVRLGFVFTAIAVPSLFVTVVKRLIGRARPSVVGSDVWSYQPFAWRVDHASLPSGHATTAFAALVAIGALFPQARGLMWIYALLIAVSRVVLVAHYPSDVVAAAIVGATGAWLVRQWFAARRLGFIVRAYGSVQPMPGPDIRRIAKAVVQRRPTA